MRPGSILSRCLVLSLAFACHRDLSLPPPSTIPRISAATPVSVFSGYTLNIAGQNFAANAASNTVQFPGVAVPASGFDAKTGALQVLVPDALPLTSADVGGSPFTVTVSNSSGNSNPSPPIGWLGNGRPILGTVVNDLRILHRTPGIAATTAGPRIASVLLHTLIGAGAGGGVAAIARTAQKPAALAATADGQVMAVGLEPGGVVLLDPNGTALASQSLGGASVRFVVPTASAASRVFAVGVDKAGTLKAWAFLPGSTAAPQERALPLLQATGAAAAPDGRTLLVAGSFSNGSRVAHALLVTHPLDPATPDDLLAAPDGRAATGALAAWADAGGARAALGLDDGSIAIFDLAARTQLALFQAGSSTRIAALVAAAGKLIASKPVEGTLAALDAQTGKALWQLRLPGMPTALAADPGGARVHVADDQSNFTDAVDTGGNWLGRTSYLAGLGNAPGCSCGAVPDYSATRSPRILVMARALRQLIEVDPNNLALHRGEVLTGTSAPLGLAQAPDGTIWVLHESELGTVDGATETIAITGLPFPPTRLAFASDGSVLVGSLQDLTVVRNGSVVSVQHLPGTLALLEPRPGGTVLVIWSASGGASAGGGIFTVGALGSGGQPLLPLPALTSAQGFLGAVSQLAGPTLFFASAGQVRNAGLSLDPQTLQPGAPFPSSVKERGPLESTPDGLYFLWAREASPDAILHIASYYDAVNGVRDYELYQLGGAFGIPALDPSGAYVYTPLPDLDAITVMQ